ncbi:hypothetical protein GTA08_BOTSDO01210 [Neofusicoccum parvum]|nr:hypothetical protein GTA08_BOTSDO01210 [Neofusicoccum parvum]
MAAVHDVPSFLPEVWTLYGIGVVIFALRFFVRVRTVGARGFCGDDYFAMVSVVCLTIDGIVVDRAYHHGTAVEFTRDQIDKMTTEEVHSVGIGSKFEFMGWFSYPGLIWSMKAMMLFFYGRLTFRLWQQKVVRVLSFVVFASYISVLFTVLFSCRPFVANWQVRPDPGLQCSFHPQNVAVVSILNIATDVALLSIPIPLLWTLQMRLKQKIVMGCFLLSGILVIAAAIVRVVVTLGSHPSTLTINLWGIRETVVAVICVNAPMVRPLCSRKFWSLESQPTELTSGRAYGSATTSRHRPITIQPTYTNKITGGEPPKLPVVIERRSREESRVNSPDGATDDTDSEQLIIMRNGSFHGVVVEVEVQVESEERSYRDPKRDVEKGRFPWTKGW